MVKRSRDPENNTDVSIQYFMVRAYINVYCDTHVTFFIDITGQTEKKTKAEDQ
jgi:hypothetical protein